MFESVFSLLADGNVPPQLKANLFSAVGRLGSAALDIPTAYLEGKAAEIRANNEATIMLLDEAAAQIAEGMDVNAEYSIAAGNKFAGKIIREQLNLDKTISFAANEIRESQVNNCEGKREGPQEPIDEDWLNTFETEARQKSTEEFQFLFGKILAGEIRQPGTFSIKTIRILGSIDKSTAEVFRRLCSLTVQTKAASQIGDARVPSLGSAAESNSLSTFGLDFRNLNSLNEHGLIISDFNSWIDYSGRTGKFTVGPNLHVFLPLVYQGKNWILMPASNGSIKQEFKVHGVALTASGRELLQIVDFEPAEQYTQALVAFFANNGLVMTETSETGPHLRSIVC